MKKLHCSKTYK